MARKVEVGLGGARWDVNSPSPDRTALCSESDATSFQIEQHENPDWGGSSPDGALVQRHTEPRLLRVLQNTPMLALVAPRQPEK
jgi:hypothetical protein